MTNPTNMLFASSTTVDDDARELLLRQPALHQLVEEALEEMHSAFDEAQLSVEYVVDPEDDEPVEQIYVAAYTPRGDRLQQLRKVNRTWWRRHPQYGTAPLTLTVHGV